METKLHTLTLTVDEIKDLAEFAGLSVVGEITEDDKETKITIEPCPEQGIKDEDDGSMWHSRYIAYLEEYPEEGAMPLGAAVKGEESQEGKFYE